MKHLIKLFIIFFVVIIGYSCGIKSIGKQEKNYIFSNQEQELEYYYAFTEATKQAMFNNYKDAINLYTKCLKYNPASAATHFQLSNIYMRLGEIDIAKNHARNAIRRDNNNIWYYLHLAAIYQMQRNIDSTIVMYEKIVDLDQYNKEYLYNMALLYKEAKDYDKALRTIKRIEDSTSVNERIIYLKHDLYSSLGRKKEAIKELKEGIGYFPEDINMYGLLAEYYSEIGELEEADNVYMLILRKDSTNSKVILSYADYLIGIGKEDKSFEFYRKAIEDPGMIINNKLMIIASLINDEQIFRSSDGHLMNLIDQINNDYVNNMDARLLRIDFNIKSNRYEAASDDLKYIVRDNPDNMNAWKQLIYIENYMNLYDSVIYHAKIASGIFREETAFYIMEGLAWLQKGENNIAIDVLLEGEQYSKRTEEKVQIYGYLAELYRNIGNNLLSDTYFEKVLKIDENNILLRNNYSYYLALRDSALKKAEKLSRYTIEKEPLNPTYLDTYAWILYKMGKYRIALKYIERAIKNDEGNNTEILDHYGDILSKLYKYEKALNIWERIIELGGTSDVLEEKILRHRELIKSRK